MSLQNENIDRERTCSFPSILHRVRSNLEDYAHGNKSADERFGKFCGECTEPKGFVFFFLREGNEKAKSGGIGFFIVRNKKAWSFPICVEVNNSDKFKDFETQSKTNSPLYVIMFQDQHVVDTFIHQECIDFAKDIHKDIDANCSKQFCIFSLLPNKIDSVSMNNLIIQNCQQLNQEYYGSRFAFAVILRGKLEKDCTEDYDALIKFINEKFMPKGIKDQSETKTAIGNKLSEFKQTAESQLNTAKEQIGNAMHNVKNRAGELVSNVQSILSNDSNNTQTVTVSPTKEEKDKSKSEQGGSEKGISTGAKSSTLEAGKEKIKETLSNIKDKTSEKAQDLKSTIENRFTTSNDKDNTAYDASLQKESINEKGKALPSQSEDTKSKNKDSAISNVPLYRNVENKNEMENTDSNLRKEIREKQPLLMQEKPEDEKKPLGSKIQDLKGFAEQQLTSAKEQIGDKLNNVKTKTEGLVSNLQTNATVSDDSGKEKKEKAVESPVQESKNLLPKHSEKNENIAKRSHEKESESSLTKTIKGIFFGGDKNKEENDLIDHNLRQKNRESQPLFQQEPPQEDANVRSENVDKNPEQQKTSLATGEKNMNVKATKNKTEDLDK